MDSLVSAYGTYIILGLIIVCAIFLILCVILFVKISKLEKRTNRFMKQGVDKSVEELLYEHLEVTRAVESKFNNLGNAINDINSRLRLCISKTGLVRYNNFENVGGDLCFALALLDEMKNGVVINALFTREGSYIYAKPVENGTSSHSLSDEEKKAILMATERN